ncbi:hypothetical protein M1N91_03490, partial [Dehalococcoidia bacterium]|nr:hypothetical protein [Dehalococcoidia bacterium]
PLSRHWITIDGDVFPTCQMLLHQVNYFTGSALLQKYLMVFPDCIFAENMVLCKTVCRARDTLSQ